MTKRDKREEARSLRRQGISIIVIARQLKAPKSSVSTWCRDIQLTPEQEAALQHSDARRKAQVKGAGANVAIHREKRRRYQEQGRQKACEGDPLHLAGCMLYWAEGSKRRNMVEFVNSDPEMMVLFNRFLREALSVDKEKIKFSIRCYMGNGVPLTEIEDYWSTLLDISKDNISLRDHLKSFLLSQFCGSVSDAPLRLNHFSDVGAGLRPARYQDVDFSNGF
ncbi:MAG: hypothetical protein L0154_04015, partial [Chloroflexi bacterium]|nr:hypothetical protein [Chloroflexota bacterium]